MIRIDHVTFSYGEENENAGGVHDINLTVEDGQCVVLCGESGSGKTTITRLINGLIPHYYEGKMKRLAACFKTPAHNFSMWTQPAKSHSGVKISASRSKVFGND